MGLIQTLEPWYEQPWEAVQTTEPAAFAWHAGAAEVESARGISASVVNASPAATAWGRAIACAGGASAASLQRYSFDARALGSVFGTGKPATLLLQLRGVSTTLGLGLIAGCGRPSVGRMLFGLRANVSGAFLFICHNGAWTEVGFGAGSGVGNSLATIAVSHDGANTLRLVHGGVSYGSQTFASTAFPTTVAGELLHIGCTHASGGSDLFWGAAAEHIGMLILPRAMSVEEMQWATRGNAPFWSYFAPRNIDIPYAAAPALPTLSLPTFVPGSLSTTGWRGQVTATI